MDGARIYHGRNQSKLTAERKMNSQGVDIDMGGMNS